MKLIEAIKNEDTLQCMILLENGIDFRSTDARGISPLMLASRHGMYNVVDELLKRGADPENLEVEYGWSALTFACMNGHLECVHLLLEAGAKPYTYNKDGLGVLGIALQTGRDDILEILLKAGANPNGHDDTMWTPLHYACRYNKPNMVKILLEAGGKLINRNKDNQTPLDIAIQNNFEECKELLLGTHIGE